MRRPEGTVAVDSRGVPIEVGTLILTGSAGRLITVTKPFAYSTGYTGRGWRMRKRRDGWRAVQEERIFHLDCSLVVTEEEMRDVPEGGLFLWWARTHGRYSR